MKCIKWLNKFLADIKADLSQGRYDRSRSKIEDYNTENELLIEEAKNLQVRRENKKIKDIINQEKRFIRSGKTYTLMSFIVFLSNLSLSIGGGCTITKNMLFIGIYILVMCVLEGTIYISAKTKNDDMRYFAIHYKALNFFRGVLMITSISLNILFFHNLFNDLLIDFIMSPLCVSLGFLSIRFSALGYDKKYLNYSKSLDSENISTFGKLFIVVTNPLRHRINEAYNKINQPSNFSKDENYTVKVVENDLKVAETNSKDVENESKDIENESKDIEIFFNDENENAKVVKIFSKVENENSKIDGNISKDDERLINDIERYIRKNWKSDEIVSTSQIKKEFNLTEHKWKTIKSNIKNIYTTPNKRTIAK
jgi:hypothetical protein